MAASINSTSSQKLENKKVHPWRVCPLGEHVVHKHTYHVPPSKTHPDGIFSTRQEHCAKNPSKKDILTSHEMKLISDNHFSDLKKLPKSGVLKFENADIYDIEIAGWVQFWNEIFKPVVDLDPNLVKALIAKESSFDKKQKNFANKRVGTARGLMQITDETLGILHNQKGELKDHLLYLATNDLFSPSLNICAGVRWLFQKQYTASYRLKREATWTEAVAEYKGVLKKMITGENPNPIEMTLFNEQYKLLQD